MRDQPGAGSLMASSLWDSHAGSGGRAAPQVWQVGALCRAVADALEARFNPITVQGEVSGFSRAASGHCYLSLKDAQGQLRCAMFRRAASALDFVPRDGELVQVRGRLAVYEPRGDLQLIIDSMSRVGQGALFEQFLRLKEKLQAEGLFDEARKRPLPVLPRAIGLVTSLGAAALHDVVTALQRRAPHVRVLLAPAAVQGAQAAPEMVRALRQLYAQAAGDDDGTNADAVPAIELILIVRGGGSLEDLWAFNDETLVRTIAQSPVPVLSGVGHETDFSLVDFCADLRAPTPTAAAEMVTQDRSVWLAALDAAQTRLSAAVWRVLDSQSQRLDQLGAGLARPSHLVARQRMALELLAQRLRHSLPAQVNIRREAQRRLEERAARLWGHIGGQARQRLEHLALRLQAVDPRRVLARGYAWVEQVDGQALTRAGQAQIDQALQVRLQDGRLHVKVLAADLQQPLIHVNPAE